MADLPELDVVLPLDSINDLHPDAIVRCPLQGATVEWFCGSSKSSLRSKRVEKNSASMFSISPVSGSSAGGMEEFGAPIRFVLHVFQKKSKSGRQTPRRDIELIEQRLREAEQLARGRKQ